MVNEDWDRINAFVETEYSRVVAAVALIAGNREDASDAVQSALVGFLAKPPRHEIRNLAAWITVVASNGARQQYRRDASRQRAYERLQQQAPGYEASSDSLDDEVKNALSALPQKQRQVCVLHYLLDQSVEQIAETLGVTNGTVKTQLHRGRKTLAQLLQPEVNHV